MRDWLLCFFGFHKWAHECESSMGYVYDTMYCSRGGRCRYAGMKWTDVTRLR